MLIASRRFEGGFAMYDLLRHWQSNGILIWLYKWSQKCHWWTLAESTKDLSRDKSSNYGRLAFKYLLRRSNCFSVTITSNIKGPILLFEILPCATTFVTCILSFCIRVNSCFTSGYVLLLFDLCSCKLPFVWFSVSLSVVTHFC